MGEISWFLAVGKGCVANLLHFIQNKMENVNLLFLNGNLFAREKFCNESAVHIWKYYCR